MSRFALVAVFAFALPGFGADPAGDHDRLLREFGGRRVNLTDPAASLSKLGTGWKPVLQD